MNLVAKISDLLDDEPLMDVILACASAAAITIKELPLDKQAAAQKAVSEMIDTMLKEWSGSVAFDSEGRHGAGC